LAIIAYSTYSYNRGIIGQQSIHYILIVRALLEVLAGGVLDKLADLLHVSIHLPPRVLSHCAALLLVLLSVGELRDRDGPNG
jgi:hypothetical protein